MSRRLVLADLLNPEDDSELVDVRPQLESLTELASLELGTVLAPVSVQHHLLAALRCLGHHPQPTMTPSPPPPPPTASRTTATAQPTSPPLTPPLDSVSITLDVVLNRKTTLSTLYEHPLHAYVEYPQTSAEHDRPVGHLFRLDPNKWRTPEVDFAYSRGAPTGRTQIGKEVYCRILVDQNTGTEVPCSERHSTCQGSKACPFSDLEMLSEPHDHASRTSVQRRLKMDRDERLAGASPSRAIFQKTAAFISGITKLGCRGPQFEPTLRIPSELERREELEQYHTRIQRGYKPSEKYCDGRLIFKYNHYTLKPSLRCEHYSKHTNKDHLLDYSIGDGSYDLDYIDAVFNEDAEEIDRIENAANALGFGPLTECTTVSNFSTQKLYCPFDHRDPDFHLVQPEMTVLTCTCKFRIFEPIEEFRQVCPYVLVTIQGPHTHPIPLPTKTPTNVKEKIFGLLDNLAEDLADMTPRRFIRHPTVKAYLRTMFEGVPCPTLSDLHISLANRSHLDAYILQAKEIYFPSGTGWKGVLHLKDIQDEQLPKEQHYIRKILVIDAAGLPQHEEDDPSDSEHGEPEIRIIICMTKEGSERLLRSSGYIQSDIGFKRVVGFLEFEMACMDRDANTSVIFCRVYINKRQTAVVHQRIFEGIEAIVEEDTGRRLKWRHLHAGALGEYEGMILQWTVDQHPGQAKGLGLHLEQLAQLEQTRNKYDLHETSRKLSSLNPYEHLHRILRICTVHTFRNIRSCPVSDSVRLLMRSLVCMVHSDWDGTIQAIKDHGGKAGLDWIKDKERTKFAFQGMCWEKSFIPEEVWRAGEANSNLIETVHRDVNREGVQCTLVGGLKKGQLFDKVKMTTLKALEDQGIRPTYKTGHLSENAVKNLKRKYNAHHDILLGEDQKIEKHNEKLTKAHSNLQAARQKLITNTAALDNPDLHSQPAKRQRLISGLQRSAKAETKAAATYDAEVETGLGLAKSGSGKVSILLPNRQYAMDTRNTR